MLTVVGLDHVVLRTRNMDAMLEFYRDILGCPLDRVSKGLAGLVHLRAGSSLIDLLDVTRAEGPDATVGAAGERVDHICLQVGPISEADLLAHLDSHGIAHGDFAGRYGALGDGRTLYLTDPDGNGVELRIVEAR